MDLDVAIGRVNEHHDFITQNGQVLKEVVANWPRIKALLDELDRYPHEPEELEEERPQPQPVRRLSAESNAV